MIRKIRKLYPVPLIVVIPLIVGMLLSLNQDRIAQAKVASYSPIFIPLQIETPTLVAPEDGTLMSNNQPTFSWNFVEGAVTYQLQMADSPSFSTPTIDVTVSDLSFTLETALNDAQYYWRVRAKDATHTWSNWSLGWTVTVDTISPLAPELKKPEHSSTLQDITPEFKWFLAHETEQYQLQVATDSSFSNLSIDIYLDSKRYVSHPLDDNQYYWRVRARDESGNWSNWSVVWQVTINSIPSDPPVLLAPADGTLTNDPTPTFFWTALAETVEYRLQLAEQPDFSTPIVDIYSDSLSETLSSPLTDGLYYWRVQAKDEIGNWSDWSPLWAMTIDTLPPDIPDLLAPPDESLLQFANPIFNWGSVLEADRYQLQIATDSNFSLLVYDDIMEDASVTYFSLMLEDGLYYWRVRASDEAGNWSDWSVEWQVILDTLPPNSPALIEPEDGSIIQDTLPTFDWTSISEATEYRLQIALDSQFANVLVDVSRDTSIYSSLTPLSSGTYHWRVQASDEAGNESVWSEIWTLTIDTLPPTEPVLLLPPNGKIISDMTPTFNWSELSEAVEYHFQVAPGTDFSNLIIDTHIDPSTYTPVITLSDKLYYWRVRARDDFGNWSEWSTLWNVTVDTTAPAVPTLLTPDDGLFTSNTTPTFRWDDVLDAEKYHFQVATNSLFSSLVIDTQLNTTSYTPTLILNNSLYHWRVKAEDVAGNQGDWTASWQITIDNRPPTSSVTLPSESVMESFTVSWNGIDGGSGIKNYDLQYNDNGSSWQDWQIDTTETSALFAAIQNEHTYCFRVRAEDWAGNIETYSNEEDACVTVLFKPDLYLSELSLSKNNICVGEPVTLQTTIHNQGQGSADGHTVTYYEDATLSGYFQAIGSSTIGALSPHSNLMHEQVLTPTQTGVHYLKALLDVDNQIDEFDEANNGAYTFLSVGYDTVPPTGSIKVNGGTGYTSQRTLLLRLAATDGGECSSGLTQMNLFYNGSWHGWEPYSTNKIILLGGKDGPYTVSVQYRDGSGYLSEVYTSDVFVLDTVPPTSSVTDLIQQSDASIDVYWGGSDSSGIACYEIQVREGTTHPWITWQDCTTATSGTYVGSNGQIYYFRSRAKDQADNWESYPFNPDYDKYTMLEISEEESGDIYLPLIVR